MLILGLTKLLTGTSYKNDSLLTLKSHNKTKTLGELTSQIKSKTKRGYIKKILFLEDSKNIISFISDTDDIVNTDNTDNTDTKETVETVGIYKTISNEEINRHLISTCIKYNINYGVGKKITHNLSSSIYSNLNFFVNRILFPYLYLMVILNILMIGNKIIDIISSDDEYPNIMMSTSNTHNLTKSSNSSSSSTFSNFGLVQKESPYKFTHPNVKLSNWVGSPEIFEECYEIISYQLNNSNYKKLGAVLPKGILLEGPPGVGKTYLAKAIATETNSSFITMSGSEFIEMYVGVGASRVRELFKLARTNSPSIIFIDEIDAIGGKRSGGGGGSGGDGGAHREHDQTLNQLLTEMDGFKDNSEIIVLAATNRKDTLDPALLRPGRFDRHIHISLPDKYSRSQILKLYLGEKKRIERGINVTMIAELTDGFSGADLKNLINEAAILAVRRGGKKITSADLTNGMEKLVVGLERGIDERSEEAKRRVSVHEVGHGFLTIYFTKYFDLQKISIKSTYNGAGGYTLMTPKSEFMSGGLWTKDLLLKKIIILLGGKAAESIWYGGEHVSFGATQDLRQANQLARTMVEMYGMGSGDLETFYNPNSNPNYANRLISTHSEKTKELVDEEILKIISNAYQQSKEILEKNKLICDELVDKVLEKQVLYRNDLNFYYNMKLND